MLKYCLSNLSIMPLFFYILSALFCLNNDAVKETAVKPERIEKQRSAEPAYLKKYNQMELQENGLSAELFKKGFHGYSNLKSSGLVKNDIIMLVDFTKPSTEKRMWIIDLKNNKLLKNTLVAHGKNSGQNIASVFSNLPNSYMSSLGCYVTGDTYFGKHGLSLRLKGLDQGFNTNAFERAIVLHGAEYVSEDFIKCNGRLGRSHGCPAVPVSENKEIIEMIKGGSFLFINGTNPDYTSEFVN